MNIGDKVFINYTRLHVREKATKKALVKYDNNNSIKLKQSLNKIEHCNKKINILTCLNVVYVYILLTTIKSQNIEDI